MTAASDTAPPRQPAAQGDGTEHDPRVGRRPEEVGLIGLLAVAASQTVVVTAVLSYFGWARANATLRHFGLDPNMIGYETSDYVLRSISVLFPAAVGAAVGSLALLALHHRFVDPALAREDARRPSPIAVSTGGYALVAMLAGAVLAGLAWPATVGTRLGAALPLLILAAAGLLAYLGHLRHRIAHPGPAGSSRTADRARAVLLGSLGLLAAFWAAGLHADATGTRAATDLAAGLATRPEIILYADRDLGIEGTGVELTRAAPGDGVRYAVRYRGLRLLTSSEDSLMLLPATWQRGRDRLFVVPIDEAVRMDIASR